MANVYAYIDESGNPDLNIDREGVSDYFIVLAIIVKSIDVDSVLEQVEKIREKHFQLGEMKSNSLKNKDGHQRRIKILSDILGLNFRFYAVVVDKSAVYKDGGMQHKKSFLKFVNGLLYRQLFQSFNEASIVADEHGSQEFIESFRNYIDKKHKPDLFWQSSVEIVKSKEYVMVQLADFVVGTIAKIYEDKSNPALNEAYHLLMKKKALHVHEWPTRYQIYYPPIQDSEEFDSFIYTHSLSQAEIFLKANEDVFDDEIKLQYSVLRHLVFISRFNTLDEYVPTQEILNHLREIGFNDVTEQAIRSRIVAKLRDSGVLISSCNRGYKIPKGYKDLVDFVERVNGLVMPLLDRLKKARQSYMIASHGKVDLLRGPSFPELTAFIDQLEK